jgi:hypothetical protein
MIAAAHLIADNATAGQNHHPRSFRGNCGDAALE